jgi:hypothetical protein
MPITPLALIGLVTSEQWCRERGIHVPTQAERDAEAIERLLAMEAQA